MQSGTVIKSTGKWYDVREDVSSDIFKCRIKGKFRLENFRLTNPVAVGDRVKFAAIDAEELTGTIQEIEPRKNYLIRRSPRMKMHQHLIATNIDQIMLVVTVVEPLLKPGFIDRIMLLAESQDIPLIIVFNKGDVYDDAAIERFVYHRDLYENLGYKVVMVSALDGRGMETIRELLKDKTSMLTGQSGVGKSTMINGIQPNLNLSTKEVSNYHGKGQHTTTFAEMFELDFGGRIIDTPGIKTLGFMHMEAAAVAHNFRPYFELSSNCRFRDCLHINEPGCAVKAALEIGDLTVKRYENYLGIIEEVNNINTWEMDEG